MQESEQQAANPFAMPEIPASRRLVKSPPELWAEVSDAASLARHLGEVGEITITRLEPETTVAWEGERASGTVELAPAGWGTSVTLTAEPVGVAEQPPTPEPAPEPLAPAEPQPDPAAIAAPEPELTVAASQPEPAAAAKPIAEPQPAADAAPVRRSWLARLFSRTPKPAEPEVSEDARPPAEGPVSAHPEGHRPRSGWSGPARHAAQPEDEEPAAPEPQPEPASDPLEDVLTHALDSLGQAHHRPFSRG